MLSSGRSVGPHRIARATAVLGSLLILAACSTGEVASRAADARSSAAAVADVARSVRYKEACLATRSELATLGSLARRLADDPSLGVRLAPQVTAAAEQLTAKIADSSAEWRTVLDAASTLAEAAHDANAASVRLTASQVVLAVRVAQAGCAVATR
jgi:hypothetical protein